MLIACFLLTFVMVVLRKGLLKPRIFPNHRVIAVGFIVTIVIIALAKLSDGNAVDPCAQFPDMELFLPLAATEDTFREFHDLFLWSFDFFWPRTPDVRLLYLVNADAPNHAAFAQRLVEASAGRTVRTAFPAPPPVPIKGHDRQQWLMFWADNFTTAAHVGFLDSDSVFVTRVTRDDLFSPTGQPRVIVVHGKPLNDFWVATPRATHAMLGYAEPFKGMTCFPVTIKTAHLRAMRAHVVRHMQTATFDDAYLRIVRELHIYSQFNVMVTYLWHHHRADYVWDITEQEPGWSGPVPEGQAASAAAAGVTPALLAGAQPRLAVHWTYETFRDTPHAYRDIMRLGYCYARGSSGENVDSDDGGDTSANADPLPGYCRGVDVTKPNPYEWTFERTDYSGRAHVPAAHAARMQRLRSCAAHSFPSDKLASLD